MIIKQTRIPVGDAGAFQAYLMRPGENEHVESLVGDLDIIEDNNLISRLQGLTYGTRHFIVSPDQRLTTAQLGNVLTAISEEFGIPDGSLQRMCVVLHQKQRADGEHGSGIHYHIAIPEYDDQTGRVLSSSFFKMRNEKVARRCELALGHDVIPGRFNREVYTALQADGINVQRYEEALREACRREDIPETEWLSYRAESAFSPDTQKGSERKTSPGDAFRSSSQVRQHIKGLSRDPAAIMLALERDGFEIGPGRKPGVWVVSRDGVPFGSLDRLAKLSKEAVNEAATERFGHPAVWDSARSDAPRRPGNERHRTRDKGASGRSGDGFRGADASGTDVRTAGDAGGTRGRGRTLDEDRAGARNRSS